jgi:hypothetical protein
MIAADTRKVIEFRSTPARGPRRAGASGPPSRSIKGSPLSSTMRTRRSKSARMRAGGGEPHEHRGLLGRVGQTVCEATSSSATTCGISAFGRDRRRATDLHEEHDEVDEREALREEQPEGERGAREVARDHEAPAVEAVHQHAGERAQQQRREELGARIPATANDEPPESDVTSGMSNPMTSQSPIPLTELTAHSRRKRGVGEQPRYAPPDSASASSVRAHLEPGGDAHL